MTVSLLLLCIATLLSLALSLRLVREGKGKEGEQSRTDRSRDPRSKNRLHRTVNSEHGISDWWSDNPTYLRHVASYHFIL
ncbi:hypothetical protein IAT40_001301 [Kwoniella sp. CBS 6097]